MSANRLIWDRAFARTAARATRTGVILLFIAWLIDCIDRLVSTLALRSIGQEFNLDRPSRA